MHEKFIEVTRGGIVESVHYGSAAVTTADGKLVSAAGDPRLVSFYRSASKPLQAIPLVESGAADYFGLTEEEIAIVCGSHGGEDIHLAAVGSILEKIGVNEDTLLCGVHPPMDRAAAKQRSAVGLEPTQICNNCSGKHAGMLALCAFYGWDTAGYVEPEHPVQRLMLETIASFCGLQPDEVVRGIDGCSVVTFGVSIYHMALSFVRLLDPPAEWSSERRAACKRVAAAMVAHPEMVAARQGRLDTILMRAYGDSLIAKSGAEAVYCVAVKPNGERPALGLAIKLLDGDQGLRATNTAVTGLLEEAGLLDETLREQLAQYGTQTLLNRAGREVGQVRSVLKLRERKPGVHVA